MKLLSFLFPRIIAKVNSPISGEIKVVEQFGKRSIKVGGLEQSGAFIGGIWKKALKKTQNLKTSKTQSVLILGLGAGTVAKLVNKFWPGAKIVGLEIDPVVIKLGRRYFDLDEIPNLEIINFDAVKFLEKIDYLLYANHYSLILVDVYLGDRVPQSCETDEFLKRVKKLLAPGGLAIFNRLFYKEKKKEAENFIKKLRKIFSQISSVRTPSNLLIFAQK